MDVRETITQLYRDYEARNLENILAALPDDFDFDRSLLAIQGWNSGAPRRVLRYCPGRETQHAADLNR